MSIFGPYLDRQHVQLIEPDTIPSDAQEDIVNNLTVRLKQLLQESLKDATRTQYDIDEMVKKEGYHPVYDTLPKPQKVDVNDVNSMEVTYQYVLRVLILRANYFLDIFPDGRRRLPTKDEITDDVKRVCEKLAKHFTVLARQKAAANFAAIRQEVYDAFVATVRSDLKQSEEHLKSLPRFSFNTAVKEARQDLLARTQAVPEKLKLADAWLNSK